MRFNEALRKVTLEFKQKFLGECLNGEHCPVGVGPGLIPHPLDPAGGLHTGNWLHEIQHRGVGIDPLLHGNIGGVTFGQHHGHYARQIWSVLWGDSQNLGADAGFMKLTAVEIPCTMTVDRLGWIAGTSVIGNNNLGIYQDNGDQPDGGALIVQTGSLAVGPGTNRKKEYAIPATELAPRLYWFAHLNSDSLLSMKFHADQQGPGGTLISRQVDTGYVDPLPNPCPATIPHPYGIPMYARVLSVP